jgi:hypothetical protein
LAEAAETPGERTKRIARVQRVALRFYRTVVEHLGEEEARSLFETFLKRTRGQPSGSRNPIRDGELYEEYLANLGKVTSDPEREALPRVLAEEMSRTRGSYFGNSAVAIEKKLRRILKKQQDPRWRLKAAKDQLEVLRRRPLGEPWGGGEG